MKTIRVLSAQKDNIPYYIQEDCKVRYIRYADDFLIGVMGDKEISREILNRVLLFCESELSMSIHEDKTGIRHRKDGVIYLGYKI